MAKRTQQEIDQEQKDREFLQSVGFCTAKGWWEEDYKLQRKENAHEHWLIFGYE